MVQYTVAIFFNTCIDLWTVMLLAQGFSVQDVAGKMADPTHAMGEDNILSPKALAEQPAVQRQAYTQLLTYLFPGCLLVPWLCEPLGITVITYFLPKWLVRSRKEVTVADAEKRLAPPEYDLARYGDIIVNIMLCVLTMAFTYRDLWEVWAWMFLSLCIIYVWDHYRMLRICSRTLFSSPVMEYTAQWIIAVPCAMMASLVVFHVWAASDDGFLEPLTVVVRHALHLDTTGHVSFLLSRHTILRYMFFAFVGHLVLHFSLLLWIVPKFSKDMADHDDKVPYPETAKISPCTWFNSNPVHCLRSKYIYEHEPPCVVFRPSKEHLLQAAPRIGQYFQPKQPSEDTPRLTKRSSTGLSFLDSLTRGV